MQNFLLACEILISQYNSGLFNFTAVTNSHDFKAVNFQVLNKSFLVDEFNLTTSRAINNFTVLCNMTNSVLINYLSQAFGTVET